MYVKLSPEKVQELREERGLNRRALAEAAELSPKTLRRAEGARGPVQVETAQKIARALDLEDPRVLSATPNPRDAVVYRRWGK